MEKTKDYTLKGPIQTSIMLTWKHQTKRRTKISECQPGIHSFHIMHVRHFKYNLHKVVCTTLLLKLGTLTLESSKALFRLI